jgi:DNA-binding NarL/FixJ family response regulator
MAQPFRVVVVGGHPVIVGVVRLACEASDVLDLVASFTVEANVPLDDVLAAVPEVIVLDMDLAVSEGAKELRAIRGAGYTGWVLALSDRGDGPAVLGAMQAGADGYLLKTDGLPRIGDAIVRLTRGERVLGDDLERAAVRELGRRARQAREGAGVDAVLTPREREILTLLAEGLTIKQIGRRLGISPRTVETHVSKLYRKLEVRTRVQAVARAASLGLTELA